MHKNRGFTFLEILISLLLLSIILLGSYAIQLTALKAAKASFYFFIASQQITNVTNRLIILQGHDIQSETIAWNKQNEALLPNGKGEIKGKFPQYLIIIKWGKKVIDKCQKNEIGQSGCIQLQVSL